MKIGRDVALGYWVFPKLKGTFGGPYRKAYNFMGPPCRETTSDQLGESTPEAHGDGHSCGTAGQHWICDCSTACLEGGVCQIQHAPWPE